MTHHTLTITATGSTEAGTGGEVLRPALDELADAARIHAERQRSAAGVHADRQPGRCVATAELHVVDDLARARAA